MHNSALKPHSIVLHSIFLFTINYRKTKYSPSAFAHFCPVLMLLLNLLFTLVSLLFFHGELILGCGSQKCKLEPDLFSPSKARIASQLMFCSLILVTEKMSQAESRLCNCLSPIFSGLLSHTLHPSSVYSPLQSGVGVSSQLLDRLRVASWWFGGLL